MGEFLIEDIETRLEEIANSLALEDWSINEFTDARQLKWESNGLERNIEIQETTLDSTNEAVEISFAVWEDDYEKGVRKWNMGQIAIIESGYLTVLSEALYTAVEQTLLVEQSDLEIIDKI